MATRKRRSLYGTRQSLTVPNISKNSRLSVHLPDRITYRYKSLEVVRNNQFDARLLTTITERTWALYRITGLNKLQNTAAKRKQYATYIKNELVKSIKDTYRDVTFKVEITELNENEENLNTLQIDVFYKKGDDKPILKYKAIIISLSNNNIQDFTDLSLILCTGAVNITKIVHKSLFLLFDTKILPLKISENDLMWLSAILCDVDSRNSVTFEFSLNGSTMRNSLSFPLPCNLIKKLWNHIHLDEAEEVSFEEVHNFHKKLQDQIEATYGINLKFFKLNKIFMCDATVGSEGKIRIFNEEAIEKIFTFLNEISLIIDIPYTEMGLDIEYSDDEY